MTSIKSASSSKSMLVARDYLSKAGGFLGRVGKALLFPIAVLPIAAILLRIGAAIPGGGTDFSNGVGSFISQSGGFVFDNLHILFAVGIAFGLAKDSRGEAAISGLVGMLLLTQLMKKGGGVDLTGKIYGNVDLGEGKIGFASLFGTRYDQILATNVLSGFFAGGLVAYIYNRFNGVQLPSVLGFFSGRRLIPVLVVMSIMVFGILYAIIFPWLGYVLFKLSEALADARGDRYANAAIMGVYGILNRLLIPIGLHHIPNSFFWFGIDTGLTQTVDGKVSPIFGDIFGFLNGPAQGNTSGTFQSGFFPIMMFGLPAIALAFYMTAESKEQKRQVATVFGSAALVSFLTGITEPIEFAFLFVAPWLFVTHALLTGLFGFVTGLFGIQLGFGFSAGLFDYGLSLPKSLSIIDANKTGADAIFANPGWIWVIGAVTAVTYYYTAKVMILKLNLQTPGRGTGKIAAELSGTASTTTTTSGTKTAAGAMSPRADAYVKALGGYANITNPTNCTTRLRYDVVDSSKVDEAALKKAGAKGVIKISKNHVHVIVGLDVEKLNDEIIAHRPVAK